MLGKLTQYAVICCHGRDSKQFLQGQLTCNLKLLSNQKNKNSKLAAHCSSAGRIISLFRLIQKNESHYYLVLPKPMLDITLSHLNKYAVFSEVELRDVSQAIILIGHDVNVRELDSQHNIITTEVRENIELSLFHNTHLSSANLVNLEDISAHWHLLMIQNGIPSIYPDTSEKFIPQRLNLFELGGLSFKKGCYLGQEILARLHYRGSVKYRMVLGEVGAQTTLFPGEKITDSNQKTIGYVIDSASKNNKTSLLFEKIISANPDDLYIQQSKIQQLLLPYEDAYLPKD